MSCVFGQMLYINGIHYSCPDPTPLWPLCVRGIFLIFKNHLEQTTSGESSKPKVRPGPRVFTANMFACFDGPVRARGKRTRAPRPKIRGSNFTVRFLNRHPFRGRATSRYARRGVRSPWAHRVYYTGLRYSR